MEKWRHLNRKASLFCVPVLTAIFTDARFNAAAFLVDRQSLNIVICVGLLLISGVTYSCCLDTDPGEAVELSTIALSL